MKEHSGVAAIKLEAKQDIIKLLKSYNPKYYIIGLETAKGVHALTNGEHFHFVYAMEDNDHEAFLTQLKRKYNLGSKNQPDKAYCGFVTKINKIEETKSYCLKHNNYVTEGIEKEELEKLYKNSYIKDEKKDDTKEAAEYLHENLSEFQLTDEYDEDYNLINARHHNFDLRMMENIIFRYLRRNSTKVITYHRIHYVGSYYLQNYHQDKEEDNILYLKKRF